MKNMMKWFMEEEDGQGMVEYALLFALVALVAVVGLGAIGKGVVSFFERLVEEMPGNA